VEANEDLASSPDLVNKDPYGDGWLVRFTVEDPEEMNGLMDPEAYAPYAEKALEEGVH